MRPLCLLVTSLVALCPLETGAAQQRRSADSISARGWMTVLQRTGSPRGLPAEYLLALSTGSQGTRERLVLQPSLLAQARSEILCPMPVVRPRFVPFMPKVRLPAVTDAMPVDTTGCRNPLFQPDSLVPGQPTPQRRR